MIAGATLWNFYFELFEETIASGHVIVFLQHLVRHIPGKLLIVWDGLPAHRSKIVTEYVRSLNRRIHVERLPAYAPELNPVEYIWAYLKHHGTSQRLSERSVATRSWGGTVSETNAQTKTSDQGLLAAGFFVGLTPLYYAKINKPITGNWKGMPAAFNSGIDAALWRQSNGKIYFFKAISISASAMSMWAWTRDIPNRLQATGRECPPISTTASMRFCSAKTIARSICSRAISMCAFRTLPMAWMPGSEANRGQLEGHAR
jgi:transposase